MGEGEGHVDTKLVQSLRGVRSSTRLWSGQGSCGKRNSFWGTARRMRAIPASVLPGMKSSGT